MPPPFEDAHDVDAAAVMEDASSLVNEEEDISNDTDDSAVDDVDDDDAAAATKTKSLSAPPLPTSSATSTTNTTTKFFGVDVRRYSHHDHEAPDFTNDAGLRAVMEPHIAKARHRRKQALAATSSSTKTATATAVVASDLYQALRLEHAGRYDPNQFSLAQQLAQLLNLPSHVPLSQLHHYCPDGLAEKRAFLAPLLQRDQRRAFQQTFDDFVAKVCVPHFHRRCQQFVLLQQQQQQQKQQAAAAAAVRCDVDIEATTTTTTTSNKNNSSPEQPLPPPPPPPPRHYAVRYQAFPCIRVVRPGEFSIGPHCDVAYGHSAASINVHVPLTTTSTTRMTTMNTNSSTSALYTESSPGREDWHALVQCCSGCDDNDDDDDNANKNTDNDNNTAFFVVFNGAECIHFTLENTTEETRVSLDFRMALVASSTEQTPQHEQEHNGDGSTDPSSWSRLLWCNSSPAATSLQDRYSDPPGYYDWMDVISCEEDDDDTDYDEDEDNHDIERQHVIESFRVQKQRPAGQLLDPDRRVGFPFTNPPQP